jgi:hypothetical protein
MVANKCTSSAGRFEGHGGAPERYIRHCPMQHVQGYSGSHCTPASGNYSLRIFQAAARATGKQTTINKYTHFAGRFDGHCNAVVQYRVHCLIEEIQGYDGSHWLLPPDCSQ